MAWANMSPSMKEPAMLVGCKWTVLCMQGEGFCGVKDDRCVYLVTVQR